MTSLCFCSTPTLLLLCLGLVAIHFVPRRGPCPFLVASPLLHTALFLILLLVRQSDIASLVFRPVRWSLTGSQVAISVLTCSGEAPRKHVGSNTQSLIVSSSLRGACICITDGRSSTRHLAAAMSSPVCFPPYPLSPLRLVFLAPRPAVDNSSCRLRSMRTVAAAAVQTSKLHVPG